MTKIYDNITDLIGNTPIIELSRLAAKHNIKTKLFAKLEYFNPSGSVKDRAAIAMVKDAKNNGKINKDTTIIEPTSGNTGIALASVAAVEGYSLVLTMPDTMSEERQKLLKAYGAKIVLTEGRLGMTGAIEKAHELSKTIPNSIILGQFDNFANAKIHYMTTGKEIYKATEGKLDYLVCGVGTGGTITGTGKYLKEKNSSIKIVAVEPTLSPVLSKGQKGAHPLQGIGAGFVPSILDRDIIDEVITVSEEESFETARELAREEGILVGISSGSALFAAIKIAALQQDKEKNIVVILPDTGERYLSTKLFE